MTDGPFRNAPLTSRWKKFGDLCKSDARSPKERAQQAEHALRKDLFTKEFRALTREIDAYIKGPQNDLLPKFKIDTIFNKYPRSPQSDILQKFFKANNDRPMLLSDAWNLAYDSTVRHEVSLIRNRTREEFLNARERGDLLRKDFGKCVQRSDEAFAQVNYSSLREAGLGKDAPSRISIIKLDSVEVGPES